MFQDLGADTQYQKNLINNYTNIIFIPYWCPDNTVLTLKLIEFE